ncbi:MAG: peptidylprolyl isomerase [Candidatus Babeliaceae bacterium]
MKRYLLFPLTILLFLLIFNFQGGFKLLGTSKDPIVVIQTNQGDIEVRLFPAVAPKTVENFIGLTRKKYYENTIFHRIIPGFMIQGGDPLGNGTGGKSIWGTAFKDEFDAKVTFDKPFLLAMANAGPNTNGSQFFITTIPTPWLNNKHTIFGEVINGKDVVKRIESAGTTSGKPTSQQTIIKIYEKGEKK